MSWVMRKLAHCDQCEHEWLPANGEFPKQCPNRNCRSRIWNTLSEVVDAMRDAIDTQMAVIEKQETGVNTVPDRKCWCGSQVYVWCDPNRNMPERYKCIDKGHFSTIVR